MKTFQLWTDLVHKALAAKFPRTKRSHTQEALAAAFGHKTYASFLMQDLGLINAGAVKYILLDHRAAAERANALGFKVSLEEWIQATMVLKPSGVSGDAWFTDMPGMGSAALILFEDSGGASHTIAKRHGAMPGGRRVPFERRPVLDSDMSVPERLTIPLQGEQIVMGDPMNIVVPVSATAKFERIARRGYAQGRLTDILESGSTYLEEPEEPLADVYGPGYS